MQSSEMSCAKLNAMKPSNFEYGIICTLAFLFSVEEPQFLEEQILMFSCE